MPTIHGASRLWRAGLPLRPYSEVGIVTHRPSLSSPLTVFFLVAYPMMSSVPPSLAQRAVDACFSPEPPTPEAFVAIAKAIGELDAAGYAALWAEANTILSGQPVSAAQQAQYAETADPRIRMVRLIATLLPWAPAAIQRRIIDSIRREAQESTASRGPSAAPEPPGPTPRR